MKRKLYIEASQRGPIFLKPAERAEMDAAERLFRESDEGRAACRIVTLTAPSSCDTQGHDYAFGICSGCGLANPEEEEECEHTDFYPNGYCCDCGEPVPDFEPDDDMIEADQSRRWAA